MSEYADREQTYYKSLPGMVSQQIEAQVMAACKGMMKNAEFYQEVAKLPQLTIQEKLDIIYSDQPLNFGITIPGMATVNLQPYGPTNSEIEFSMSVHASTEETSDSEAAGKVEASGSAGFGMFHASVKSSGSFSKHSATKRESDYTATVDVKVSMGRLEVPETLAKVMDMIGEVTNAGAAINLAIVQEQSKLSLQKASGADKSKAPEPLSPSKDGDDSGGDGQAGDQGGDQ